MNIKIIAVGKLKESYWRDAVSEYSKRLNAYCSLEIIEVKESRLPANPSAADEAAVKAAEAAGYAHIASADSEKTLETVLREITDIETGGPVFLEIRCACGARSDLGRPKTTPQENRDALMHFVTKS